MINKIVRKFIVIKNNIIRNWINIIYFIKFRLLKPNYGCNTKKRETKIIVSLTSFPARIDKVHLCIKSLLVQSVKPDYIVIYLGRDEFKGKSLPTNLTSLFKYGVEVRFREDLKPHKKYFYSMQEFPDSIIITVDDDVYYRPNLIKDLLNAHLKHPNCVICTRAHKMRIKNNELLPYNSWDYETKEIKKESKLLFATGVGGVLYPPHVLSNETFNIDVIKRTCLKQDDVWLKFMEILSNVKVLAIPSTKTKYVVGIWNSEEINLNSMNVGQRKNDEAIKNVMNVFNIKIKDLEE